MRDVPCNELVELVTDYLDGALPAERRAEVEAHLSICAGCREVVAQWRHIIAWGGRLGETEVAAVDPEIRAGLLAAFRNRRPPAV
jgi:anti-sigma factor RsiW